MDNKVKNRTNREAVTREETEVRNKLKGTDVAREASSTRQTRGHHTGSPPGKGELNSYRA